MGDDDFGDFCKQVGKDVPVYRACGDCGDLCIVNSETYDSPKVICDPGFCERAVPFCICGDLVLGTDRELEKCSFPNCARRPPLET